MTDLNKLRSEFEAIETVSEILKDTEISFCESNNRYYHTIYTTFIPDEVHFLNGGWYAWQEKAKPQAVPVWISTDFMKPDDHDCVDILINAKRRIVDAVYLDGKFFIFPPFSKEQWTEVNNKVTHWMPRVDVASESGAEG